ncbi:MAG: ABC transporter permease [Bacteroidota bacterium]
MSRSRHGFLVFSRTTNIVLSCLFFIVFLFVSVWRWSIVSSGALSLVLTPVALIFAQAESSRFLRSDLWEYWIAAAVWILILLAFIRCLFAVFLHSKRESIPDGSAEPPRPFVASERIGKLVLLVFVFLALTAPFVAPFQPSSQGDLTTMRLLKPLERGVVTKSGILETEGSSLVSTSNSLLRILEGTNQVLLNRQEKFTRLSDLPTAEGRVESAQIRTFYLGTDDLGRDVLSRIIYGTRISLGIGFAAMCFAVFLGCLIGFLAGVYGGWMDRLLMRFTDLFLAVPSLFLVIALVALFGNSTALLITVLAATGWMGVARLVRGEVLVLREREFVLSARLLGRSPLQILRDHMIPNVTPTILAASVLQLANVVLAEAALSFLGLGVQPPTPSWGNMIGESMAYLESAWWVGVFPGIALSLLVISSNLVAEGIEKTAHTFT